MSGRESINWVLFDVFHFSFVRLDVHSMTNETGNDKWGCVGGKIEQTNSELRTLNSEL